MTEAMMGARLGEAMRDSIRETMGVDVSDVTAGLVADRLVTKLAGLVELVPVDSDVREESSLGGRCIHCNVREALHANAGHKFGPGAR